MGREALGDPTFEISVRTYRRWESGRPGWPRPDYVDALRAAFDAAPEDLGFTHPPGQSASATYLEGPVHRRESVKLAALTVAMPGAVAAILRQATDDAAEFTRQAEATTLGSGTLDHLDHAIATFNGAYSIQPPHALFETVLHYRRHVGALLGGRYTLRQGRELYAFAGWLSELLAWLAHDLGDARAGLAFATDAFVHGFEAGHGELCAWATDASASISLYSLRPDKALAAAEKGLSQSPTGHPLTVRLHAQAARAGAALGDPRRFAVSLRAAEEAHRVLPARVRTRFGMDPMPLGDYALMSYPATACIWLGQAEKARAYAEHALQTYVAAPEASRSPSREAIARIDLAMAHAQLGELDDAVAFGREALQSTRVVDSVRSRADGLASYLERRYPRDLAGEQFREELRVLQAMPQPELTALQGVSP
ncbi:tetratricopeptide repeat protein [Yinghuangia sp. ASG 101]|uniref:tetratricopeptide repeat protein n=1 Tax=Yinghuangia sp. ASG 101 TaxID=2896848 RepID=UPI001E5B63CE|nr:tetratricopeptide repeat protein [Yinghuangia sp. ASG 101]UGQ12369.1 tetratricopeptide repeat protein [Yinghuangia sp. ASG 101]